MMFIMNSKIIRTGDLTTYCCKQNKIIIFFSQFSSVMINSNRDLKNVLLHEVIILQLYLFNCACTAMTNKLINTFDIQRCIGVPIHGE